MRRWLLLAIALCVQFSIAFIGERAALAVEYASVEEGYYTIMSSGTASFLTVDSASVSTAPPTDAFAGQVFHISASELGYTLVPTRFSGDQVIASIEDFLQAGSAVILSNYEGQSSQCWLMEKIDTRYVLHNAEDPSLVLTESEGRIILESSNEDDCQLWKLLPHEGEEEQPQPTAEIFWENIHAFPSKHSAYLTAKIRASYAGAISDFHLNVWDQNGYLVASRDEAGSESQQLNMNIWYEVYSETGVILDLNTQYYYQFWITFDGARYESPRYSFTTSNGNERHFGIDISSHNGTVDWDKVAGHIDYAVLRCGFGGDYSQYDDTKWAYNVAACERLGIPYGVYLYSYAENDEEAKDEAEHVIRLLEGHRLALPVYYDLEDAGTVGALSNEQIARQVSIFRTRLEEAGYESGVYANDNWWRNRLRGISIDSDDVWFAAWSGAYANQSYGLWQFTSNGHVPGISERVDLDYCKDFSVIARNQTSEEDVDADFVLPAGLVTIAPEAFENNAFTYAKLGEQVRMIGSKAFADCRNLRYIYIPEVCEHISEDAFEGCTDLTIIGDAGSYAEFYAGEYGFAFKAAR